MALKIRPLADMAIKLHLGRISFCTGISHRGPQGSTPGPGADGAEWAMDVVPLLQDGALALLVGSMPFKRRAR